MMKWSVHPEVITILNVYALSNRASRYINQKLIEMQGAFEELTITVRDFHPCLPMINKIIV